MIDRRNAVTHRIYSVCHLTHNADILTFPMSSSSSPTLASAKDNPVDKNDEYATKISEDETRNADLTESGADPNSNTAAEAPFLPCNHKPGPNTRNLIVCIDGTSNQFENNNTNVIELYHLILKVGKKQHTWYNSGIGTYARQSWKSFNYYKQVLYHKIDLAIAWDFERTILGAYRWLSDNYEQGDRIFLFGFSRGAYQIRVLSAMIEKVGLIYKGNEMQIPFAYELYADPTSDIPPEETNGQENLSKAGHFKKTFSNEDVKVHFVGAWDTVSSIGIARGKSMLPGTVDGMKHVCYFRHALALDENRVKFLPEYAYGGSSKPSDNTKNIASGKTAPHTKEVWFAGSHSDIGGGNEDNHAMNNNTPPLRWMVYEAVDAGLRTAIFKRKAKEHKEIKITESLTWGWYFLEICPFKRLTFEQTENDEPTETETSPTTRWPHLGAGRKIHPGQKIHISVVWSAAGSIPEDYIPNALPPRSEHSLWQDLRDMEKEPVTNSSNKWLERDFYEYSRIAVEKLVIEGDDKVMKELHNLETSGSANNRQAVYNNVIEALQDNQGLALEIKNRLLHTTMQLLKKGLGDNPDFTRRPSYEIRPLLSDLFCANAGYQQTACEFVTEFTQLSSKVNLKYSRGLSGSAISPDGKRIAAGSIDGAVRIWDAKTGNPVGKPLEGLAMVHDDWVTSVTFSHDGKRIVSGSEDKTIRIWDAQTGRPVRGPLGGHGGPVVSVAFSPDDTRIVSGSEDKTIRIWDAESGSQVGEPLRGHNRWVLAVAFSSNGERIVSGSLDKTIRIWDAETGNQVGEPLRGHDDSIRSVAFSPDGTHIVSGSEDKTVRIWDAKTDILGRKTLRGHHDWVRSVAFSPDGMRIVSGSKDGTIRIWDVRTGSPVGEPLRGHGEMVLSVAFSPDGTRIVSGSKDKTIRIWDAKTGSSGEPLQGHDGLVWSVAFSPDGTRIASGSKDRTICIWDAKTGSPVGERFRGQDHPVLSVAFSPDGTHIVSGSEGDEIWIWNVKTGSRVGEPLRGHDDMVLSVAFSTDGTRIVSGSRDKTIRIWDAENGSPFGQPLRGHDHWVCSVAFSPDGKQIVSGSGDRTIRIWDAGTGSPVRKPLEGHDDWIRSVVFSPDGTKIVSGSDDRTIRIWDPEIDSPLGEPLRAQGHTDDVRSVGFSPDGTRIVSGSDDRTVRIWDVNTGSPVGEPLEKHPGDVRSVAFSLDGRRIVSVSRDGTVHIWDAEALKMRGYQTQKHE